MRRPCCPSLGSVRAACRPARAQAASGQKPRPWRRGGVQECAAASSWRNHALLTALRRRAEVSKAFQTLSDAEKRAHYDQFGDEEEAPARQFRRQHHGHGGFTHVYADELSPEDLFNMFFGGAFPGAAAVSFCHPTPSPPTPAPDPSHPPRTASARAHAPASYACPALARAPYAVRGRG